MKKTTLILILLCGCTLFVHAYNTETIKCLDNATKENETAPFVFNDALFNEIIHQKLFNKVKGYSLVVGNEKGIQAKVSGGWAKIPGDGNLPMKTNVASGIGSVFKTISAVALLNIFSRHIHSSKTVQEQLDMKMIHQLPDRWKTKFTGTGIEKISYRNLLTHKSGISRNKETIEKVEQMGLAYEKGFYHYLNMSYGFKESNVGVERKYENTNIGLLVWLIPSLAYPQKVKNIQNTYDHINDPKRHSQEMIKEYAALYEKYIREHIFSKVTPKIKPIYKPTNNVKYAKYYHTNGSSGVIDNSHAHAQGGWMISAQDYANFARTFYHTNTFFGPITRKSLYVDDTKETRDNMIVFSGQLFDDRFADTTEYYPSHNGAEDQYRAVFTILPNNYYAIIMVNSTIMKNSNDKKTDITNEVIKDIVFDAFYETTRGKPINLDRHGIPEAEYYRILRVMDENGSAVVWADFYNVNGKIYVNAIFKPTTKKWLSRHDLSASAYQSVYDEYWDQGYRPLHIDTYRKGSQIKYSVIMKKTNTKNYKAFHNKTLTVFKQKLDIYKNKGYVPMNITCSSNGEDEIFAASFKKIPNSNWKVKYLLPISNLKPTIDDMENKGMIPVSVNAYTHKGKNYCTAIFIEQQQKYKYVVGKGPIKYLETFEKHTKEGYDLKSITGYDEGSKHRFAALWWK